MDKKKRWLELLGFFALFVGLFILLSLVTYHPLDPPGSSRPGFANKGGKIGAFTAYYLYAYFGYSSWLIVLSLFSVSIQLIRQRPDLFGWSSAAGWLLLLVGLAAMMSLGSPMAGGVVGLYFVTRFEPLIGQAGVFLLFIFVFLVGVSLHSARSIQETLIETSNLFKQLYEGIKTGGALLREYNDWLIEKTRSFWDSWFKGSERTASPSPARSSAPTKNSSKTKSSSETDTSSAEEESGEKDSEKAESDTPVVSLAEKKESSDVQTGPDKEEKPRGANGSSPVEVDQKRPAVDEADMSTYDFPPLELLESGNIDEAIPDEETQEKVAAKLENTFDEFGIDAEVVDANSGPVLTMYEVEPGPGVSVNKFQSRADDIKLSLAVQSVRIVSPIPGKSAVGIEVSNPERALVKLRDVLGTSEFNSEENNLPLGFGLDVFGEPLVVDLEALPHLLIAGATGSGKSVCINSIICSLLYHLPPDELKLILIDPKRVELKLYDDLPHLITEVIDDPDDATKSLKWAVEEMEERYERLSEAGYRDINGYNEAVDKDEKMPYIVIIVDELADLMLVNPKECEQSITRLAQMARAVGIHLVVATQRPSTDVITGLIKANMPARVAFRVSSGTDSRVILDENGAETLLGDGDLLYLSAASPHPRRAQGSFLTDKETKDVIRFVKEQLRPSYLDEDAIFGSGTIGELEEDFDDEYYEDAKKLVVETGKASASMIQRRFRVGYNRAARMVDMMEEEGIVGPHRGSKARRVLVDEGEYFEETENEE